MYLNPELAHIPAGGPAPVAAPPEAVHVAEQVPVQIPESECMALGAAAVLPQPQTEQTVPQEVPVRRYDDSGPATLRTVLGTNAAGATIEAARALDPRDSRVFLRRPGRNQANTDNVARMSSGAVYTGHLITREEVQYRRAHGSL